MILILDGGKWKEFFNEFEFGQRAITDLIDGIKSDLDENFERKGGFSFKLLLR